MIISCKYWLSLHDKTQHWHQNKLAVHFNFLQNFSNYLYLCPVSVLVFLIVMDLYYPNDIYHQDQDLIIFNCLSHKSFMTRSYTAFEFDEQITEMTFSCWQWILMMKRWNKKLDKTKTSILAWLLCKPSILYH